MVQMYGTISASHGSTPEKSAVMTDISHLAENIDQLDEELLKQYNRLPAYP